MDKPFSGGIPQVTPMASLLFNVVMICLDLLGLLSLSRRRTIPTCCAVFVGLAFAGGLLAAVFCESRFGFLRLLTWALFFHGTLLLVGAAVLMWRSRRWWAVVAAIGAIGLVAVAIDALLIEPTWLEVSHLRIASAKVKRPLRIVVFADIQTDQIGEYERSCFRRAIEEKPDIVLYAGDYLQAYGQAWEDLRGPFHDLVEQLERETGAQGFAVRGNIDPYHWVDLFDGLNVRTTNPRRSFPTDDLDITCLSLSDSRNISRKIARPSPDRFHIVLGHMPNFAQGPVDADLLIAGHTHGGQIRLPFFGPIITHSLNPRAWAAGATQLPGGDRMLVVSRGVGMERLNAPRMRFLCRPELVVIDVVPTLE